MQEHSFTERFLAIRKMLTRDGFIHAIDMRGTEGTVGKLLEDLCKAVDVLQHPQQVKQKRKQRRNWWRPRTT